MSVHVGGESYDQKGESVCKLVTPKSCLQHLYLIKGGWGGRVSG